MEWVEEVISTFDVEGFRRDLIHWYDKNKRDLPWRKERDPYKIWVSEIMLQQTKVDTVIPYFERFMEQFPSIEKLAEADEEEVLKAWEGLGYYSRARNLHHAVKEVKEKYGGKVPSTMKEVSSLKGIGPYTAGAILSIAFNKPAPAVDGNVMRVFSRIFFISDDISQAKTRKKFEYVVQQVISEQFPGEFNQGLMDLGATICTPRSPGCLLCPVRKYCLAQEKGVQDLLPVKKKSKAPKEKKMKAVVLFNEAGEVLIEKRPDEGLLSNLWQFPNVEALKMKEGDNSKGKVPSSSVKKEERSVVTELESYLWDEGGLRVKIKPTVIQQVRHVFSHLIWDIDVFEGVVLEVRDERIFNESALRFVPIDEVEEKYPFPVSHQKIYRLSVLERVHCEK